VAYVPDIYKEFYRQFPRSAVACDELAFRCPGRTMPDAKARQLLKLSIAIDLNSEAGLRSYARQALEEGITPRELRDAAPLGLTTVGFLR
jgi:alkylhydroperoxidase/carboxymuconolactone decarboxylase family protein YurZ